MAVVLAALAMWDMRREISERAASPLRWAVPPALAIVAAAILLIVSPGKRWELWAVCIGVGLVAGLAAGVIVKAEKDFAQNLSRMYRTWDGVAAAALLLLLAVIRFVSTDLMHRPSGGFGVLGALAALLAAFQVGRVLTFQLHTAPRAIHYDMVPGQKRHRTHDDG
ncbi:MAG: hypothetical protein J0J01_17785 [Reyranella sp.]|nr:hypothetical protein [Reyranella sp.]